MSCDGCGKPRKCFSVLRDANGDPDVGVCFICHQEAKRGRIYDHKTGTYKRPGEDPCPDCGKDRTNMNAMVRGFHPGAC